MVQERKIPSTASTPDKMRYKFARNFLRGKRVADIGCGVGYGTDILGPLAEGFDVEPDAVNVARETYANKFHLGDAAKADYSGFEAAVAFEFLEHMEDPGPVVRRLYESLPDGALFFGSVPNADVYNFDPEDWKDHKYPHFRHYKSEELPGLFEPFKIIGLWCQPGRRHPKEISLSIYPGCAGLFHIVAAVK